MRNISSETVDRIGADIPVPTSDMGDPLRFVEASLTFKILGFDPFPVRG